MTPRPLALPLCAALLLTASPVFAQSSSSTSPLSSLDTARRLVTAEDKGHCQACHQFPNDPSIRTRATIGPALAGMRARFPDRQRLIAVIRDARGSNPETIMPPYGPHRILTESEIVAIADYLLRQ
jgi:L-cysteine S-thiosulfotransferase